MTKNAFHRTKAAISLTFCTGFLIANFKVQEERQQRHTHRIKTPARERVGAAEAGGEPEPDAEQLPRRVHQQERNI